VFGCRLLKEVNKQLLEGHLIALVAEGLVTVSGSMVTNSRKDAWKEVTLGFDKLPTVAKTRGGTCKGCSLATPKQGRTVHKGDTTYFKEPCLVCSVSGKETPEESWCKSFEGKSSTTGSS
jgi:hypothetical protein